MKKLIINSNTRNGLIDMWNAFMVQKAKFTRNDIPISTGTSQIPKQLISIDDAKSIYKNKVKNDKSFHYPAFIHFYIDDQKFDGKQSSIWLYPERALKIIKHFDGIITPDWSTNSDFPKPLKLYNIYRMRAYGAWMELEGIPFIHNVRWGTRETWEYCFDGIPQGSTVSIGTIASGLKQNINHKLFEDGFKRMIETIKPKIIIVYGSANYRFFEYAKKLGIEVISFPSSTFLAFKSERR